MKPEINVQPAPVLLVKQDGGHLDFLDGIRGLAAMYVLVYHLWGEVAWSAYRDIWPAIEHGWFRLLAYGYFSVSVFIVVSGYSLVLPVVRSGSGLLRGGLAGYLKQRFLRIVPPYYAAIAFSPLLVWAVPGLQRAQGVYWDASLPAFSWGGIVSHTLLLQNLNPRWVYLINAPLWSVATEWQIYFFFPLVFLPVRRMTGWLASLAVGWIIGCGIYFLWRAQLASAHPWYLGLFAMGMAAAVIGERYTVSIYVRIPFGALSATMTAFTVVVLAYVPSLNRYNVLMDGLVGLAVSSLLVHCAIRRTRSRPSWILRSLQGPLPVFFAGFSYSIYLVHAPIIAAAAVGLRYIHASPGMALTLFFTVALPLCLVTAYIFHRWFELPFMSNRVRQPQTEIFLRRHRAKFKRHE